MTSTRLIRQARAAEFALARASQSINTNAHQVHVTFRKHAAWLVPAMGVASGLVLATTSGRWRDKALFRIVPMLGGGGFSLLFSVLGRRGWF